MNISAHSCVNTTLKRQKSHLKADLVPITPRPPVGHPAFCTYPKSRFAFPPSPLLRPKQPGGGRAFLGSSRFHKSRSDQFEKQKQKIKVSSNIRASRPEGRSVEICGNLLSRLKSGDPSVREGSCCFCFKNLLWILQLWKYMTAGRAVPSEALFIAKIPIICAERRVLVKTRTNAQPWIQLSGQSLWSGWGGREREDCGVKLVWKVQKKLRFISSTDAAFKSCGRYEWQESQTR